MARKATVLLIEDDAHDVELMKLAFVRANSPFGLVYVCDGSDGIRYLAGEGIYADRDQFPKPDLVLLDLALPRVDGFEVLKWIRSQAEGSMPPVVVLSYSRMASDMRRALELGARDYWTKPVDLNSTVDLVQRLTNFHQPGP